jgi:hypothetical protein
VPSDHGNRVLELARFDGQVVWLDYAACFLAVGELGEPFVDVTVDQVELPRRVTVAEVRSPAPQHRVEVADNQRQVTTGVAPRGVISDLGP